MTEVAKRFRRGCHRSCPPEETWERIRPLLPRAGITRLADVTGLDVVGISVFQAVRPASRNLSVSQGKGATAAAARVSAAMEALELWHAEDLGRLPSVVMTAAEMAYDNAVPPSALAWAAPQDEEEPTPLEWLRARALTGGRPGWLPRALVELDFTHPEELPPRPFELTSSGLASGNCAAEALVHALCELLERHAVATAREQPARRRPLDLASVTDADGAALVAAIRRAGFKLAVHDVGGDLGLPVLEAELAAADLPLVFRGSGCHPSAAVAFSRAVTEAAQSRLTYVSGAREDVQLDSVDADLAALDSFREPAGGAAFADLPDRATPTIDGDLAWLVALLTRMGIEPFAVDLTRPDVGLPVVRVVAPGLRELRGHG